MKSQPLTTGLRVSLSKTELQTLLALAEHAVSDHRCYLSEKQQATASNLVDGLRSGLAALRFKQAEAKARRDAPRRQSERRSAHEHHLEIDGYRVWGMLGDWTDVSEDPDRRQWADMFHPDTQPREQGEIRRNVWRIFISKGSASAEDLTVLPGDCTRSADRGEIADLARRIIANEAA